MFRSGTEHMKGRVESFWVRGGWLLEEEAIGEFWADEQTWTDLGFKRCLSVFCGESRYK